MCGFVPQPHTDGRSLFVALFVFLRCTAVDECLVDIWFAETCKPTFFTFTCCYCLIQTLAQGLLGAHIHWSNSIRQAWTSGNLATNSTKFLGNKWFKIKTFDARTQRLALHNWCAVGIMQCAVAQLIDLRILFSPAKCLISLVWRSFALGCMFQWLNLRPGTWGYNCCVQLHWHLSFHNFTSNISKIKGEN